MVPIQIASVIALSTTQYSVRTIMATLITLELVTIRIWPSNHLPWKRPYQGALQDNSAESLVGKPFQRFSDFDIYTLQRSDEDFKVFAKWYRVARRQALSVPIRPGARLVIRTQTPATEQLKSHRSPYPSFAMPPESKDIVTRHPRTRCHEMDSVLKTRELVELEVVEVKRAEENTYSQVFIVRVDGCSDRFCMKLYDERMFDLADDLDLDVYFSTEPPQCLRHVICSDDLAKRELAVYKRLQRLQGSILPHSYGVHWVSTRPLYEHRV